VLLLDAVLVPLSLVVACVSTGGTELVVDDDAEVEPVDDLGTVVSAGIGAASAVTVLVGGSVVLVLGEVVLDAVGAALSVGAVPPADNRLLPDVL